MFKQQPKKQVYAKQANIVKLNKLPSNSNLSIAFSKASTQYMIVNSSNVSFESNSSISSSFLSTREIITPIVDTSTYNNECEVNGLTSQLYVLKDYKSDLAYGDLKVKRGELVYMVCDMSEMYYLVENSKGNQGFVPKDICIDLEQTIKAAKDVMSKPILYSKITSL